MGSVYANVIPILNARFVSMQDILSNKYDIKKIGIDSEIIINNLIIDFIKNYSGSLIIKSTRLINDEVISAIAANPNITEICLGSRDDIYKLKESDYNKLNNGTIKSIVTLGVEEELDFNFDDIIYYNRDRNLISYYNYDVLMDMDEESEVHIFNSLTDNEIKYFKLLKGCTVYFDNGDYKNILASIEKLEGINPNFKYKIKVKKNDKQLFNLELFNRKSISNKISIEHGTMNMSLSKYMTYEKYLYELIKPAVSLSPYEKFLYAYNITKHYKQYKEVSVDDDRFKSRTLYKVLDNDEYMVCVGYAGMLNDLLTKLGIESTTYGVGVDVGFDLVNVASEDVDAKSMYGGHERVIVNLVDPKYGINGIYQSDPTWDNIIDEDSYIYSTMTFEEAHLAKRYLYQDKSEYSLMSSNTLEEFYNNVNKYMDSFIYNKTLAIKFTEEKARLRVVQDLLDIIEKLDRKYYISLISKYQDIEKCDTKIINKYYNDYLYDVGEYIVSKVNNPINLEQIKPAITLLYSKFYGLNEEDTKKEVNRTIEYNRKRMSDKFPTTYRINQDGTKEIYSYLENKFEENKNVK